MNFILLIALIVMNLAYLLEVLIALIQEYTNYVRISKNLHTKFFPLGNIYRWLSSLSEKRRSREPVVRYDPEDNQITLSGARKHRLFNIYKQTSRNVGYFERQYFVGVLGECVNNALAGAKFHGVPGEYFEFAFRYCLTIQHAEEAGNSAKTTITDLIDGDLSKIAEYQVQKKRQEIAKQQKIEQKNVSLMKIDGLYEAILKAEAGDADDDPQTLKSLMSQPQYSRAYTHQGRSMVDLSEYKALFDKEDEILNLFDEEILSRSIPVADLYLAVLFLKIQKKEDLKKMFELFSAKKERDRDVMYADLVTQNKKLKGIQAYFDKVTAGEKETKLTPEQMELTRCILQMHLDKLSEVINV